MTPHFYAAAFKAMALELKKIKQMNKGARLGSFENVVCAVTVHTEGQEMAMTPFEKKMLNEAFTTTDSRNKKGNAQRAKNNKTEGGHIQNARAASNKEIAVQRLKNKTAQK